MNMNASVCKSKSKCKCVYYNIKCGYYDGGGGVGMNEHTVRMKGEREN